MSAAVLASVAHAPTATAVTTNLYSVQVDGDWVDMGSNVSVAQSFTTGSNPSTLDSISVWLRNNNSPSVSYTIELWSADGLHQEPDALISTLDSGSLVGYYNNDVSGGMTVPVASVSLAPNTTYYVVMSSASIDLKWKGDNTGTPASSVGPYPPYPGYRSTDSGSTWTALTGRYRSMVVTVNETPGSSGPLPPPVLQQFGVPTMGTCSDAAPADLNWGGATSGGWSESWAEWMNGGTGAAVCSRSLVYSSSSGGWVVS
jgi:hypothetical protein